MHNINRARRGRWATNNLHMQGTRSTRSQVPDRGLLNYMTFDFRNPVENGLADDSLIFCLCSKENSSQLDAQGKLITTRCCIPNFCQDSKKYKWFCSILKHPQYILFSDANKVTGGNVLDWLRICLQIKVSSARSLLGSSSPLNFQFEFIRLLHEYIHKLHLTIILQTEATVQPGFWEVT